MNRYLKILMILVITPLFLGTYAWGLSEAFKENIYNPGKLKPIDSTLKVQVGSKAPDFTLPSVSGEQVSLSRFKGSKNVVISFVPAAWTERCCTGMLDPREAKNPPLVFPLRMTWPFGICNSIRPDTCWRRPRIPRRE